MKNFLIQQLEGNLHPTDASLHARNSSYWTKNRSISICCMAWGLCFHGLEIEFMDGQVEFAAFRSFHRKFASRLQFHRERTTSRKFTLSVCNIHHHRITCIAFCVCNNKLQGCLKLVDVDILDGQFISSLWKVFGHCVVCISPQTISELNNPTTSVSHHDVQMCSTIIWTWVVWEVRILEFVIDFTSRRNIGMRTGGWGDLPLISFEFHLFVGRELWWSFRKQRTFPLQGLVLPLLGFVPPRTAGKSVSAADGQRAPVLIRRNVWHKPSFLRVRKCF
mmetsp:Transcript_10674/g.25796  ORF Transcript_10674/g.25796 Transcript_10674/m.25796 type:complete len:277 (-) Transcript_10674:1381-2211(-)